MSIDDTFLKLITQPKSFKNADFSNEHWQELLTLARANNLLAKFAFIVNAHMEHIPQRVRNHLDSAARLASTHAQSVVHEIAEIYKVAKQVDITILKGGAYLIHDLPNARGRMLSDLDVLVAKSKLKQLEINCLMNGWIRTESEEYNDRYYRQWMHEIPPLTHLKRGTVVDIHHNILPLTNRQCPNPEAFIFEDIQHPRLGAIRTLSKTDLFIHSATHLFSESEFHNGLRDLIDLFQMAEHFQNENPNFINDTYKRSQALGLETYVYLALMCIDECLPIANRDGLLRTKLTSPFSKTKEALLAKVFIIVFKPSAKIRPTVKYHIACFFLYCRGHGLRMPMRLLIPHLAKKSYMQLKDRWRNNTKEQMI